MRELQSEQGSKDGLHISEPDAVRDFAGLLAHVRLGAEIVIVNGAYPPTILRTAAPPRRSIEECIALLPADSPATIDEDFASDVAAAAAAHRERLILRRGGRSRDALRPANLHFSRPDRRSVALTSWSAVLAASSPPE